MSGASAGQKIDLTKDETYVGRTAENDIALLGEASVSSRHCAIIREGNKYSVRDLNSTNGTKLNDTKITESRLKPKDLILAGAVELMFDGEDVEVDASVSQLSRRTVKIQVENDSGESRQPTLGGSSPFNRRRDSRTVVIVITVVLCTLAVVALGWFLFKLFKAGGQ